MADSPPNSSVAPGTTDLMVLRSLAKAARAGAGSASMYALTSIAEATVVDGRIWSSWT